MPCVYTVYVSMLPTANDSNESKNSLTRGSTLNFVNSSLQETFL
jgi:hypothetical protein